MGILLSVFAVFWVPTAALAQSGFAVRSSEQQTFFGDTLNFLAGASWDFMVATMTIAFLAAVVLEVTRDFGTRTLINLLYLQSWPFGDFVHRKRFFFSKNLTVLALAPDELCGHIASLIRSRLSNSGETDALNIALSKFRSQSSSGPAIKAERELARELIDLVDNSTREISDRVSDSEALAQVVEIIDQSIDVLQLRLRTANRWVGLALSFLTHISYPRYYSPALSFKSRPEPYSSWSL